MPKIPKVQVKTPSMRYQKGLPQVHIGRGGGNKVGKAAMLPSRDALNTITGGDPSHRTMGYYAKLTPSGAGAPGKYSDIAAMGLKGIKIR